jgi:hypothetical protein
MSKLLLSFANYQFVAPSVADHYADSQVWIHFVKPGLPHYYPTLLGSGTGYVKYHVPIARIVTKMITIAIRTSQDLLA